MLGYVAIDVEIYLQEVLGAEGISLQFRHIAGHLLWSCASPPAIAGKQQDQAALADAYQDLLHEVIHVIGYFAVSNHENQVIIKFPFALNLFLFQGCS